MAMTVGAASGRKGSASPNINVTPLVDIVLVVLIIFMLVTPMMTKTFWLNLPPKSENKPEDTAAAPPVETKPVVMTVDKSGTIRVNNVQLEKQELKERLPRVMAGANQRVLYFDAADDAAYKFAVEAMDLSRASGIKQIAILTERVAK